MTNVIPFNQQQVSTKFRDQLPADNDLGAGIQGGYGVMGYKGKVWTAKYKGEEQPLMRPDGDGPRNSIDAVILKAPAVVSKIFYEGVFVEGSTATPDCWSTNGVTPSPAAAKKQNDVCITCPKNAWGSKISQDGKPTKGKACSDAKRLAIVPANPTKEDPDMLRNEMWGGPMLLRVPAASLQDLAKHGERMKAQGYPYQSFITKIAFDPKEAYPKFTFEPVRPLTDAEADVVIELVKGAQVERVIAAEEFAPQLATAAPAVFTAPLPAQSVAPPPPPPPVPAGLTTSATWSPPPATSVAMAPPADLEAELDALLGS